MINYIDNHTDSQKSYKAIFAYIIKKGKTTRREIQKQTNYSWSSVSSVVSALINKKQVIETESFNTGVGRGTSYIMPNGDKFVSIGVEINSVGYSATVIGIDGTSKFASELPFEEKAKEQVIEKIFKIIDECIEYVNENNFTLVSIGISCQGRIDSTHSYFENFFFVEDFKHLNLKKIVEDKYNTYVYVEHDTNCLLEAYQFQHAENDESVCVARVVSGIGFAICINGYSIEDFGSIDFGHMTVQPLNGELCSCGLRGCLEAYSSTVGIAKRANVKDFQEIDNNREKYRKYLDEAAFYLGVTFNNIRRIFSIQKLIITGNVINNDQKMLDKIIDTYTSISASGVCKIKYIHDLSASFGAARLSLIDKVGTGNSL